MSSPTDPTREELRARGQAAGRALAGPAFDALVEQVRGEFDADLADLLVETFFGRVMARPALDLPTRQLVTVAALATLGSPPQLAWHIDAALNVGVTKEALREALIMVVPYSGWSFGLNGLRVFREVVQAREPGVPPTLGETAAAPDGADRATLRERGRANALKVNAAFPKVEAGLNEIDPDIAPLLLESAYGQVYGRPGLELRRREFVSVALLTVAEQPAQLKYHITGALNAGGTPDEIKEVIIQMGLLRGWPTTLNGLTAWKEVMDRRNGAGK